MDNFIYCPRCKNSLVFERIDDERVKKCNNCDFVYWNKPKPVVSMIIHSDQKVLMLQRLNKPFKNFWVLPGGFMGIDDTPEQAVEKETKEETNLIAKIEGIVGAYKIDNDPRGIHIDIIYYGTASGNIKLSNEHTGWNYFSFNKLPEKIAYKHREAIKDWSKNV